MWTYVLTKLDGTAIGEVRDATERTVSLGLNRISTAGFTMRTDNGLLLPIFNEDTKIKVYQNKTLRFHGNVVSSELQAGEGGNSVRVNAASPAWKLARRIAGQSKGGKLFTGEKAKSARKLINEANNASEYGGNAINPHTGIKLLAESEYTSGSGEYTAGPYAPVLSCINDLAHTFTGFDWYMAPIEGEVAVVSNTNGTWTTPLMAQFEAKQNFGTTRTGFEFEYGWGSKNIRSINFVRDLQDLTNKAFHIPEDMETESVLSAADETSLGYRGRFEAVADAFGIKNAALREAWLSEVIRVKKNPRFVVSMTLDVDDGHGRVPQLGTDFWLGDFVTARGVFQGATLFSGKVRVYGVDIAVSEQGDAAVTPILLDEEGTEL